MLPELFAPDHVTHGTQNLQGPEGVKQMMTVFVTAFPDYQENIENIIAEGDMVAVSYTLTGTFTGKYGDIPPTGKKLSLPYFVLARFKDGKQVESWMYGDELGFFQQMGIPIPAPQ